MKKIILFLCILLSPTISFADFCSDLSGYLKNRDIGREFLDIRDEDTGFGFNYQQDISYENAYALYDGEIDSVPYLRDEDNYLMIGAVYENGPFFEAGVSPNDRIVEINGKQVSKLSDLEIEEIHSSLELGVPTKLSIQFFENGFFKEGLEDTNGIKEIEVSKTNFKFPNAVYVAFYPYDLIEMHASDFSFELDYHLNINFYDNDPNGPLQLTKNFSDSQEMSCTYPANADEDIYSKYNIFNPLITLPSLVETKNIKKKNLIVIASKNEIYYSINTRAVSIFSNYFEFQTFPFETLNINIEYYSDYPNNDLITHKDMWDGMFLYYNDNLVDNMITQGFDIISTNYSTFLDDNWVDKESNNILNFEIEIKRQSFYYIAKVMTPIFVILLLSWGVFWIKPEEIESRLTISIICFLALVAYNFVIGDAIPKLSYLTWMDTYILLSYLVCACTTFGAIYEFRMLQKDIKNPYLSNYIASTGLVIFALLNVLIYYLLKLFS